jgi:predicted nucleic acid-binding protein
MTKILIDTRIWALGLKAPYVRLDDPSFPHASMAQLFLKRVLRKKNEILISSQLAAEIYHVLTQRGVRMSTAQARRSVQELFNRSTTTYRWITETVLGRCMDLSMASGIHLWDYLVVFPFEDGIDTIYTMDPHMQHKDFRELAQVENPIGPWKTEGQEY